MKKIFLLLLLSPATALGATYYASSSGSGTTCSMGSPCTVHQLVAGTSGNTLAADDIGILTCGTYTGDNGMIVPTAGRSGTSGHPITVSGATPGCALIDGQGARTPAELYSNNNWWVLQDFNVAHGGGGNDFNLGIFGSSANNIVRRVVGWDAPDTNSSVFWSFGTAGPNLLEDIAAFGVGRKMVSNAQGGNNLTVRRAFVSFNKSTYSDGSATAAFANAYNSFNAIFENVIANRNEDMGTVLGPDSGLLFQDREDTTPCATASYLGSIAYIKSTDTAHLESLLKGSQLVDCSTDVNTVVYDGTNTLQLVELANLNLSPPWNGPSTHHIYTNGTEIGTGGSLVQSDWTVTNRSTGATVGAVPNIWNGGGSSGARVCFQYVNGTLTSTPLWPWPMNQRIIDAMNTAGRTPIDVTATMNSIFGNIPQACGGAVPPCTNTTIGNGWTCIASTGAASGDDNTVTTPAIDTRTASLIVAVEAVDQSFTTPILTDSLSNSWMGLTKQSSTAATVRISYCSPCTTGAAQTFTVNQTGSFPSLCVAAFALSHSSPFDHENGAHTTGVMSLATGSITPTSNSSLVISGGSWDAAGAITINSGMTITNTIPAAASNFGCSLAYVTQAMAAAINPTWTFGLAQDPAVAISDFLGVANNASYGVTLLGAGR